MTAVRCPTCGVGLDEPVASDDCPIPEDHTAGPLATVAWWTDRLEEDGAIQAAAMLAAKEAGHSLREIAEAAKMSHPTVAKLVARVGGRPRLVPGIEELDRVDFAVGGAMAQAGLDARRIPDAERPAFWRALAAAASAEAS